MASTTQRKTSKFWGNVHGNKKAKRGYVIGF